MKPINSYLFALHIFLCILLCMSCSKTDTDKLTAQNKSKLIGEWYPLDDLVILDKNAGKGTESIYVSNAENFNLNGYQFREDNICENWLGFYGYMYPDDYYVLSRPSQNLETYNLHLEELDIFTPAWLWNIIRPYGNYSTYKVMNDTLLIYDPAFGEWSKQRMEFRTNDTLILSSQNDTIYERYIRSEPVKADEEPLLDQIIFYYPETPFSTDKSFAINRNDDLVSVNYFGYSYYLAKLYPGEFKRIEAMFKKADRVTPLANLNYTNVSLREDGGRVVPKITLVMDGKMKTFDNLFSELLPTNREFYWAYFSGLFLPEYASFAPYWPKKDMIVDIYESKSVFPKFERADKSTIKLFVTEQFYLTSLLLLAEETDQAFEPLYHLIGLDKEKEPVMTDGRYFSYMSGDRKITLDIGFNFIEVNGLDQ